VEIFALVDSNYFVNKRSCIQDCTSFVSVVLNKRMTVKPSSGEAVTYSEPQNTSGAASGNNLSLNSPPVKAQRPKSVNQWTVADVQKWFRRHCGEYYHLYSIKFLEQDITGRSLVRLTDNSLLRLEIVITEHRQAILREISKLRLRSNILLLKDIEMKQKHILQQSTEVH